MKRFKLTNVLKAVIMAAFILAILYAPGAVVAGTTTVSVSAPGSVAPGQTFAVNIVATPGSALSGMQFDLSYDSAKLTFVKIEEGTLLSQSGASTFFQAGSASDGQVRAVSGVIITPGKSAFAEGTFAKVTFTAKSQTGVCPLTLSNVLLGDMTGQQMQATIKNGQVSVGEGFLLTPNGGETFNAGGVMPITWNPAGISGYIKIELYKGTTRVRTISTATRASTGARNWTVPATQAAGSDYRIKLTSTSNTSVTDISDSYFTINGPPPPSLTLTSPNGGESWVAGRSQSITWSSANFTGTIKIELLKSGAVVRTISSSTSASTGYRSWSVPATQAPGSDYSIRITSASGASVTDTSDASFTITGTAPPLATTPPQATSAPPLTTTAPPAQASGKLHIQGITMRLVPYEISGKSYVMATATIVVVDENGNVVPGATVYGKWSGATADTDARAAGSTGKAVISSDIIIRSSGLGFTFTVTDIALEGYSYNAGANVIATGKITS